jgi:large subunit ribosomal protein L19
MDLIQVLENEEIARLGKKVPEFAPGDTVIVSVNVVEGTRKRVQAYERRRCRADLPNLFACHRNH